MNKTYERIAEVRDTATRIRSGDVVWIGGTEGAANEFLSALSQRRSELKNVTLLVVTGNEPNKYLELLRHTGSIRVLSFYKEAIIESYRRSGCFGKYEFVTSPAVKAIGLICRSYGVNTMVVRRLPADGGRQLCGGPEAGPDGARRERLPERHQAHRARRPQPQTLGRRLQARRL